MCKLLPLTLFLSLVMSAEFIVADSISGEQIEKLDKAQALFDDNDISIENKYRILRFVPYESGAGMIWVIPLYKGLPIFNNERAFHFNANRKVKRDSHGHAFIGGGPVIDLKNINIDTVPRISAEEAKKLFAQQPERQSIPDITGRNTFKVKRPASDANPETLNTELGIINDSTISGQRQPRFHPVLVWKITCENDYCLTYISAQSGNVLMNDTGIVSFM